MNSNQKANQAAIKQYRKELGLLLGEIANIDKVILTEAVNTGVDYVKSITPVKTGYLKKNWKSTPTLVRGGVVTKRMFNSADYSGPVNYGRKIRNKDGAVVGYTKGRYMLERAINVVNKSVESNFRQEVERVNRRYGSRP